MSEPIERIQRALASYADWQDEDVRRATFTLLEAVNTDLDAAGYVTSTDCDKALDSLEETMEDAEEEVLVKNEIEEEAEDASEDDEDEDEIVDEAEDDEDDEDEFDLPEEDDEEEAGEPLTT